VSTNLSYIGVRGTHKLGPLSGLVYQLETQIDVSATSGTANTNSNNDDVVKGGLTSRNSFIGIAKQVRKRIASARPTRPTRPRPAG